MLRVAGVCLLTLVALPANAELVTINIEGVVDTVDDSGNYLEGQVNPGDIITGWYTYDTATLDSDPSGYIGMYEYSETPFGIYLSLSGFTFQTDSLNVNFMLSVGNAGGPYSEDNYLIRSYNNLPLSDEVPVDYISWQLDDTSGTALMDDSLPVNPPSIEDWTSNHLRLESDRRFIIDAHVTSATPEPCTLLLLGTGLFAIVRRIH